LCQQPLPQADQQSRLNHWQNSTVTTANADHA